MGRTKPKPKNPFHPEYREFRWLFVNAQGLELWESLCAAWLPDNCIQTRIGDFYSTYTPDQLEKLETWGSEFIHKQPPEKADEIARLLSAVTLAAHRFGQMQFAKRNKYFEKIIPDQLTDISNPHIRILLLTWLEQKHPHVRMMLRQLKSLTATLGLGPKGIWSKHPLDLLVWLVDRHTKPNRNLSTEEAMDKAKVKEKEFLKTLFVVFEKTFMQDVDPLQRAREIDVSEWIFLTADPSQILNFLHADRANKTRLRREAREQIKNPKPQRIPKEFIYDAMEVLSDGLTGAKMELVKICVIWDFLRLLCPEENFGSESSIERAIQRNKKKPESKKPYKAFIEYFLTLRYGDRTSLKN